ncbi:MerR family transcriptional regulator [Salipiger marinus]|uniref:MerR family transcriptional regulator n=1 Tax=Salipiger marinus TaxID=555512 RepID=UPI004057EBDE
MTKSRDAFRTISEVAELLDTPAHVLRFWESKFTQVKPVKRAGGRRYYRPADIGLLAGIRKLLHDDGMTIKGVQKVLREQGVRHVATLTTFDGQTEDEDVVEAPFVEVMPEGATVLPFVAGSAPQATPDSATTPEIRDIFGYLRDTPPRPRPRVDPEPAPEAGVAYDAPAPAGGPMAPEPGADHATAPEAAETHPVAREPDPGAPPLYDAAEPDLPDAAPLTNLPDPLFNADAESLPTGAQDALRDAPADTLPEIPADTALDQAADAEEPAPHGADRLPDFLLSPLDPGPDSAADSTPGDAQELAAEDSVSASTPDLPDEAPATPEASQTPQHDPAASASEPEPATAETVIATDALPEDLAAPHSEVTPAAEDSAPQQPDRDTTSETETDFGATPEPDASAAESDLSGASESDFSATPEADLDTGHAPAFSDAPEPDDLAAAEPDLGAAAEETPLENIPAAVPPALPDLDSLPLPAPGPLGLIARIDRLSPPDAAAIGPHLSALRAFLDHRQTRA